MVVMAHQPLAVFAMDRRCIYLYHLFRNFFNVFSILNQVLIFKTTNLLQIYSNLREDFTQACFGSVTFYDTGRLSFDCLGRITQLVLCFELKHLGTINRK